MMLAQLLLSSQEKKDGGVSKPYGGPYDTYRGHKEGACLPIVGLSRRHHRYDVPRARETPYQAHENLYELLRG